MSRFLGSANKWILSWQQSRHGQDRDRRTGLPETKARRNRSRKQLTMEPIEERVLLSAPSLHALQADHMVLRVPAQRDVAQFNSASATASKKIVAVSPDLKKVAKVATTAPVTPPAIHPPQNVILGVPGQKKKKSFDVKLADVNHSQKQSAAKVHEVLKAPKLEKRAADKNSVGTPRAADSTPKIEKVTAAKASAKKKREPMSAPPTAVSTQTIDKHMTTNAKPAPKVAPRKQ